MRDEGFGRLAVALTLCALLTSRLTLVFHEFLGHGGGVLLAGGEVTDHRLFLFGGGWVSFVRPGGFSTGQLVVISLAGVLLEVAVALAALLLSRRYPRGAVAHLALQCFAFIDLIHATFYVAAGTHHGFGDGVALHRALGDQRVFLVAPLTLAVLALGFAGGRSLIRSLAHWHVHAGRGGLLARVGAAAVVAVAVHGGLMLIERETTADPTYAEVMKREAERRADRQLQAMIEVRQREGAGVVVDLEEVARVRQQLVEQYRPFPLLPLLIAGLAICCAVGAWAGAGEERGTGMPPLAKLRGLAFACLGSLLLVLALRSPWW